MGIIGGPQKKINGFLLKRYMDVYGEWVKLFNHNLINNEFFSSVNDFSEARLNDPDDVKSNKYSILTYWGEFLRDNKYTLKLVYPELSITNIWSQTNDPTQIGQGVVQNYIPIEIDSSTQGWGGLERYSGNNNTFLDGTVNHPNWYYAVGCASMWSGGVPGPGVVTTLIELWILDKPN